jgi:hypothetical protein
MNDIQNILNITFPFVESLLKDYGEFYPLASVVKNDKTVDQFLTNDKGGNEFPKSTSVIERIKSELHLKQNDFIAFAIFYDVKLKEKNTDAIAVYVEHKIESFAYTFYYPYEIIENEPKFYDSWKVIEQMEIFNS